MRLRAGLLEDASGYRGGADLGVGDAPVKSWL